MTIVCNEEAMLSVSQELKEIGTVLKATMDEVEHMIYDLSGKWQGEAGMAYAAKIVGIKRQFADVLLFTNELADALQSFAEKYCELDLNIKREIENI